MSASNEGRIFGLTPQCALSIGLLSGAIITFGAITISRQTGVLSADPLLPPCSPEQLSKAAELRPQLKAMPATMRELARSLSSNSSHIHSVATEPNPKQREVATQVAKQVTPLLRVTHEARKVLRCSGGAKALGGLGTSKVEGMHRSLWRLYGRARKQAPTSGGSHAAGAGTMKRKRAGASPYSSSTPPA